MAFYNLLLLLLPLIFSVLEKKNSKKAGESVYIEISVKLLIGIAVLFIIIRIFGNKQKLNSLLR